MSYKRLGQIDLATGVIIDGYLALIHTKHKNGFKNGWLAMNQVALDQIAKMHKELGGSGFAVMFAMLARVQMRNDYQAVNLTEIAETVGVERANVSRAMKKLVETGIFLQGPKIGVQNTYKLSPEYGWKGSAKEHRDALRINVSEGSK
jgi:Fic family protein